MAGLSRTHSLQACILVVGPTRITEFGESDAITITPNSDMVEASVSADGTPTFDATNDRSHTVAITVKQTSFAYRTLAALAKVQQTAMALGGIIPPIPFSWTNPATGDFVGDFQPVLLNLPAILGNKKSGEVQFRLYLSNPTVLYGTLITPQIVVP